MEQQLIQRIRRLEQEVARLALQETIGASGIQARAGILGLTDGVTAPASASGWGLIYIDTSGGDLKIIFGDGTTKTIVTDT